jgi:hypothetical protein
MLSPANKAILLNYFVVPKNLMTPSENYTELRIAYLSLSVLFKHL